VDTWDCLSIHEIRTECGVDPLSDEIAYEKVILPHKLSIVAKGRPCLNVLQNGWGIGECQTNQPPMVDYPRYSSAISDYADMHHFDIKYPSEHTIKGESFDAEIQMFHVHFHRGRFSNIGVLVRATGNGFNQEFQFILDEFQKVYDHNAEECEMHKERKLRGTDKESLESGRQENGGSPSTFQHDRNLTLIDQIHRIKFNPYSDAFMTTMFFYRYDGSITEPPCKDITWWVMKDPMYISFEQLNQLRNIMFTHVDRNCRKTSVHNEEQSVARPVQALGDRVMEFCQEGDFISDVAKGRPAAKQCRMRAP
jgi:hypothetical protein